MNFAIPYTCRRFLVTGGAGFIGSHLVEQLLIGEAVRVVVVDEFNDYYDPRKKWENIQKCLVNPAFRLEVADIRDRDRMVRLAQEEQLDCVIHLAARVGVRPSLVDARAYEAVNVAGTLNLLEIARDFSWKYFIFASTSSVYGPNAKAPFAEDLPLLPVSPYAATKAAAELLIHSFSQLYDLRAVCLRLFTVYGPRQRPDLAIHRFARAIKAGQPVPVFGDGTTERDYTFVDDIIEGLASSVRYAVAGASNFEILNLGTGRTVSLNRLVAVLETAIGRKAMIENRSEQPGDLPFTHADISKAARLLGYQPTTTLEDGIACFLRWLDDT